MTRIRSVTVKQEAEHQPMHFQCVVEDGEAVLALFTQQTHCSRDGKTWFVTYTRTG